MSDEHFLTTIDYINSALFVDYSQPYKSANYTSMKGFFFFFFGVGGCLRSHLSLFFFGSPGIKKKALNNGGF